MITIKTAKTSEAPRGTMLAPGFYNAVITRAFDDWDDKKSKDYIYLELEVSDESGNVTKIKDWIYVTSKTVWKVEQLLASCGKKFGAGEDITIKGSDLTGKKCLVATYKKRGSNGGVFAGILHYMRPMDLPHMGAMTAQDMEEFRLLPNGELESEQPKTTTTQAQTHQQPQAQGYRAPAAAQPQKSFREQVLDEEQEPLPF